MLSDCWQARYLPFLTTSLLNLSFFYAAKGGNGHFKEHTVWSGMGAPMSAGDVL